MKKIEFFVKHKNSIISCAVLITIFLFLASYFNPSVMFSSTITAGGDTASHYYSAVYLKEVLLPKGRIVGWMNGNYCGFPLFQVYFACPFVFMVLLSYVIPMQVAFKLVSAVGIFMLPYCTYFGLKRMHFKFPGPILGALFSLSFLFMEANSMWGGNIPSTLAGEFSFSIGFALSMLFLGLVYNGIENKRSIIICGVLLFFIGFNHAYTLLLSGLSSTFFLLTTKDFVYKLKYLTKVYVLAFFLLAFWSIPLVANMEYTSNYNVIWRIDSFFKIIPRILLPFVIIAVIGSIAHVVLSILKKSTLDKRIGYLWFGIAISIVFYLSANKIGVVDIRFFPFMQCLFMLIAAVVIQEGLKYLKHSWIAVLIITPLSLLWVVDNVSFIPHWIEWNYSGFEAKNTWKKFSKINNYLKGTESDPRVVYEHSPDHNAIGTSRAFESLPFFAGRSTLEGLYMQSSITSPFVFYIQSEISKVKSAPYPNYDYTSLNIEKSVTHLKMFNVKEFIAISDLVKSALKNSSEFELKATFPPYEIYELTTNENRYVVPLKYEPVLCKTENWKHFFYKWFKKIKINDIFLILDQGKHSRNFDYRLTSDDLKNLPRVPIDTSSAEVKEVIKNDEILIETNWIGKPLLVKFSYHKNWKVEGADRIYQVSPSFMLIYPKSNYVRLYYGYGMSDYVGRGMGLVALLMIGVFVCYRNNTQRIPLIRTVVNYTLKGERKLFETSIFVIICKCKNKILIGAVVLLLMFFGILILTQKEEAGKLYNVAIQHYDTKDYPVAKKKLLQIMNKWPDCSLADEASYFYALCFYKENDYEKTIEAFQYLVENYEGSEWVPESYWHIGLCKGYMGKHDEEIKTFEFIIDKYGVTKWAEYAKERVDIDKENKFSALYKTGLNDYDNHDYLNARENLSKIIVGTSNKKLAAEASYFFALCYYKENDYQKTIEAFKSLVDNYKESLLVPEAIWHIGLCQKYLGKFEEAIETFEDLIHNYVTTEWAGYAKERLSELLINNPIVQKLYNEGQKNYDKGDYIKARENLLKIISEWTDTTLADKASYFFSLCYYKEKNYQKTIESFQFLVNNFPESEIVPEAYWHIGLCQKYIGLTNEAIKTLEFLENNYTSTEWAGYASDLLKKLSKKM